MHASKLPPLPHYLRHMTNPGWGFREAEKKMELGKRRRPKGRGITSPFFICILLDDSNWSDINRFIQSALILDSSLLVD